MTYESMTYESMTYESMQRWHKVILRVIVPIFVAVIFRVFSTLNFIGAVIEFIRQLISHPLTRQNIGSTVDLIPEHLQASVDLLSPRAAPTSDNGSQLEVLAAVLMAVRCWIQCDSMHLQAKLLWRVNPRPC